MKLGFKIAVGIGIGVVVLAIAFTNVANVIVERAVAYRLHNTIDSAHHNKVGLLPGTSPVSRQGGPNTYFIYRVKTAADL